MTILMKSRATESTQDDAEALYAVIASCFGVAGEQLTAEMSFVEDLGGDSIDMLVLAIDLEKEFDVVIHDDALGRIRTIGDAMPCIVHARSECRRALEQALSNRAVFRQD